MLAARTSALAALSILTAIALTSCDQQDASSIKIGAILSLTGAAAPYGEDNRRGLDLAVELLNRNGGITGKKVSLDIEDLSGDPAQAVSLAHRFADDESTLAILGPTRTGETVAVARMLPSLKLPIMSVGSTGDWKSAAGDFNAWTFRSTRVDTYLIEPLLRAARDKFKVRTVAILSTANDDYSISVLPVYKAAILKLGLTLVDSEAQTAGDTDRSAQLTHIKSANPDALIINTLSSDAPSIAQQARRLGIAARFVGTAGFSNPVTWKLAAPGTLDGTLVGDNFFVGSKRAAVAEFVKQYQQKYHTDPPAYAAYAYDGLLLVADAVRRAGTSPTRQAVRDALATTTNFDGVLGSITYHGSGDADKSAVILTISNNHYELVQ